MSDWNPEVYLRYRELRRKPLRDLIDAVASVFEREGRRPERGIDLGCGTGEGTMMLHDRLALRETTGLDSSTAMIGAARERSPGSRITFRQEDIEAFCESEARYDVVFSNAALHWVPNHPELIRRLADRLEPGGVLAFQVPNNFAAATHTLSAEVSGEPAFARYFRGFRVPVHVLDPLEYAEVMHGAGLDDLEVWLKVYPQYLDEPEDVVRWVRGSHLTAYEKALVVGAGEAGEEPGRHWGRFLTRYRERLFAHLGPERPVFYPYPRVFCIGRRPPSPGPPLS